MHLGRVEVTGSFLLLFTWLNYIDTQGLVPLTLFACFLHECGHCIAILTVQNQIRLVRLSCIGAQIYLERPLSYQQEFFTALCGPIVNLLLAGCAYFIAGQELFVGINLSLAVFNLLPIGQLDGSRILHSLLSLFFSGVVADNFLRVIGYILCVVIWFSGIGLVYFSGNITLLFIASWLLVRTFLPQLSKFDIKPWI